MITKEKLIIRFNRFFRNVFYHIFFWQCAFLLYAFLFTDDHILKIYNTVFGIKSSYIVGSILGLLTSLIFTFLDVFFSDRAMRILPIRLMMFLKSILYFASAFIVLLIAAKPSLSIFINREYKQIISELPPLDIYLLRFLVYFYLACFFNNFLKGMIKKVGRGNFRSWVFGMLNKPREEERIFMFIDLKDSTTIAEKLMHKKFSHLVQDVFNDMAVVDNYNGDIYQYLGDGAIISWSIKDGLKRNNFLNSFYAFSNVLKKRDRYYQRKYGLSPKFKAGIHVGKVMVLQVGQIRRDISYNGDTLNTAARIESQCNEFKQNLLISGDLFDLIENQSEFNFKNVGNIKLKGKKKATDIYQVKKKAKKKN